MAASAPAIERTPSDRERELLARVAFLCWETRGQPENTELSRPELISRLAYALWEQRGRPEGSAERDWMEAEEYVRKLIVSEAAVCS